jgi:hypothetical protein
MTMIRSMLRAARIVVPPLLWGLLGGAVGAATYDLHIRPYCAPTSYCGFGSEGELRNRVLDIVQEMNLQWAVAGISFRPTIFPIDDTNPDYYLVPGCGRPDGDFDYTESGPACNPTVTYGECTGTCRCENLTQSCSNSGDCTGIGSGSCFPLSVQRRAAWRNQVAVQNPAAITVMLTQGARRMCANPPGPNDPSNTLYGLWLNAEERAIVRGSNWAHEMGHYFCLRHTFTRKDFADTDPAEPDHDGDACWVGDTPPDPSTVEPSDREMRCAGDQTPCDADTPCGSGNGPCQAVAVLNHHEYCAPTLQQNVDWNSPHATYCTSSCLRCYNGPCDGGASPLTPINYDPDEHAAMSYFGYVCQGPIVVSGKRMEAFSQASVNAIQQCVTTFPERTNLPDVCPGGDIDHDGICTLSDNCPFTPNTRQADGDGDGDGDACDLCPLDPLPTTDRDGDGIGDRCDADRDNDGCLNGLDDHPDMAMVWAGSTTYIGCTISSEAHYAFEGDDTDGDGFIDCYDVDDDNDAVCDGTNAYPYNGGIYGEPAPDGCQAGPDPCPTDPTDTCNKVQDGPPCPPLWLGCITTSCEEYFIKIVHVIDPAPENEVVIDDFEIHDRTIFMRPALGQTVSELAVLLQGLNVDASGTGAGAGTEGAAQTLVRMELWSHETGGLEQVIVDDYDASSIVYGDTTQGTVLAVTPDDSAGIAQILVDARWATGIEAATAPADADLDTRPDWVDNCVTAANYRQVDTDHDGFGNACDADLDGDLMVTSADVDAVLACLGADLMLSMPLSEPENGVILDGGGDAHDFPDPDAFALTLACLDADLNEDDVVDMADLQRAQAAEGTAPGPSGLRNLAPVADAGPDQQVACGLDAALDGSDSHDPDGDPLTCRWSSATCLIQDDSACSTSASCPEGTHVVGLVVNDGTTDSAPDDVVLDVACAGPGRVPPTMRVDKSPAAGTDELLLSWEASCLSGAEDYGIYEGTVGLWDSHAAVDCIDDGADLSEIVVPGAGDRYYLIAPLGTTEGSYGISSSGEERAPAAAAGACRAGQDLPDCPP